MVTQDPQAYAAQMVARLRGGASPVGPQGAVERAPLLERTIEYARTRKTAGTAIREVFDRPAQALPYLAGLSDAGIAARVWRLGRAVEAGQSLDPEDREFLVGFLKDAERPQTIGYMATKLVAQLPAFMGEFLTSAGAAAAGRAGAQAGARRLLGKGMREQLEKILATETLRDAALAQGRDKLATKLATRLAATSAGARATAAVTGGVGAIAGRVAQFGAVDALLGGGRISANAYQRAMPGLALEEDEAGQLGVAVYAGGRDFLDALPEAVLDQFIEVGSEMSGGVLKKLPLLDRARTAAAKVAESWIARHNPVGSKVGAFLKVLDRAGWQGPIEEYLEERGADTARAVTGLGEFGDIWPGLEQSAAELLAFSVPGAVVAGAEFTRGKIDAGRPAAKPVGERFAEGAAGAKDPGALPTKTVERGVSAWAKASGVTGARQVKPEELGEDEGEARDALDLGRMLGADVRLVEGEGEATSRGAMLGDGFIVLNRRAPKLEPVVWHEVSHQTRRRSPEDWDAMRAQVDEAAPGFLAAADAYWRKAYGASVGKGKAVEADLAAEESLATATEWLAPVLSYGVTEAGRADLVKVLEAQPSFLRRVKEAVLDVVAKLVGATGQNTRRGAEARLRDILADAGEASDLGIEQAARAALAILDTVQGVEARRAPGSRMGFEAVGVVRLEASTEEARAAEKAARRERQGYFRAMREAERAARPAEQAAAMGFGPDEQSVPPDLDIEQSILAARDRRRVREAAARVDAQKAAQAAEQKPKQRKPRGGKPRIVEDTDPEALPLDEAAAAASADAEGAAAMGVGPDQGMRFAPKLPATLKVNGVERPTTNSEGRPLASDEDGVRAFWRWFGESKVVDDEGRPLVVYHGTPSSGFTQFDRERTGTNVDSGYLGRGFYFTDRPQIADYYASTGAARAPGVVAAYLSLQSPFQWGHKTKGVRGLFMGAQDLPGDLTEPVLRRAGLAKSDLGGEPYLMPFAERDMARALTQEIESRGLDGVIAEFDGRPGEFVVFDPTQIKSATGNAGTFDPANPDIRFAPSLPPATRAKVHAGGLAARQMFQDRTIRVRDLLDQYGIRTNTAEDADLHGALDLAISRSGAAMDSTTERILKALAPFRGKQLADVQRAVAAYSAPQRNAWMLAERGVAEASGISDADANALFTQLRGQLGAAKVDKLLGEIESINREHLDLMVDANVLTREAADKWHAREPHYLSLRDMAEELEGDLKGFQPAGRSVAVRGPLFRKAEGRIELAGDALIAWHTSKLAQIDAAYKNKALAEQGVALAGEFAGQPDPPVRLVRKGEHKGPKEPEGGVAFFLNGERAWLVFADQQIADALKGLDAKQVGWALGAVGKVTRLFSRGVTARNPFFWPRNFLRDTLGAAFNVAAGEGRTLADGARVLAAGWQNLPHLIRYELGKATPLQARIDRAKAAGFKTTWAQRDAKDLQAAMQDAMAEGRTPMRRARRFLRALDRMSDAFEQATRLAAFEYELGRTGSEAQAALYSKRLTVNFDMRGDATSALSSVFAFFNPSVQGATRMLEAITSPKGAKLAAGLVGVGLLVEVLGFALSDDDEATGLPEYAGVSEYERSRSVVSPVKVGGVYPRLLLPYGLAAIYSAGRRMAHIASHMQGDPLDPGYKPGTAAMQMVGQITREWVPIDSTGGVVGMVTPTIAAPFADIQFNTTFTGKPLMPAASSFGRSVPDSARYFSTSTDTFSGIVAHKIADLLNLGGPEKLPTGLDVSPESVQRVLAEVMSYVGLGLSEIDRASQFLVSKRPETVTWTPLLRDLVTESTDYYVSERFYELRDKASMLKAAAGEGPAEAKQARESDPALWSMLDAFELAHKRTGDIRKRMREAETRDERRELRDQLTRVQARSVRRYYAKLEAD